MDVRPASVAPTDCDPPPRIAERGVTRRQFLKFAALMASTLALPPTYAPLIASAVAQAPRLPVIWLNGQDCAGNTEAPAGAPRPTVAEFILDIISLEYSEVLMAGAVVLFGPWAAVVALAALGFACTSRSCIRGRTWRRRSRPEYTANRALWRHDRWEEPMREM